MVVTNKNIFNKKYGFDKDEPHSVADISKITGYTLAGLQTIYNKGVGAFKTNPSSVRPNMTKESWAISRVYASVNPKTKAFALDKIHLKARKGFHMMGNGTIMKGDSHPK
jgi:hypothetical protein